MIIEAENPDAMLKDAPIVVDDYHPVTSLQERKKMEATAQSLARGRGMAATLRSLCGTAAVISPVGKIVDHGRDIHYAGMGPVIQKLFDTLTGIQMGKLPAPEGWLTEID